MNTLAPRDRVPPEPHISAKATDSQVDNCPVSGERRGMKKSREPIDELIAALCEIRRRERREKRRERQTRSAGPERPRDAPNTR
jgi:hypothetical protein